MSGAAASARLIGHCMRRRRFGGLAANRQRARLSAVRCTAAERTRVAVGGWSAEPDGPRELHARAHADTEIAKVRADVEIAKVKADAEAVREKLLLEANPELYMRYISMRFGLDEASS